LGSASVQINGVCTVHVISHFLTGWTVSLPLDCEPRDRGLIVFASISPDLDGLVVIGDLVQGRALDSCELFATYHHVLSHNLLFAVTASSVFGCLGRRKLVVGLMSLLAIHIHFLADLVGSAGPDGSIWDIPYLLPFSNAGVLSVSWQWALNAWPNIGFTIGLVGVALYSAWKRGVSPVSVFSTHANHVLVATLRHRFGEPVGLEPPV
jgi:hypothetical protein